ncbi:hypothetical protein D3C87_1840270 [compost metagenome]
MLRPKFLLKKISRNSALPIKFLKRFGRRFWDKKFFLAIKGATKPQEKLFYLNSFNLCISREAISIEVCSC